jgi:hypothetical protein
MSIGSITSAVTSAASSGSTLASLLQTSGLSADKIKIVEGDLADTRQSLASSMSASVSGTVDSTAFRAAIDAKIADDVASGKLTAKDAEAVGKALDQIEGTASGASGTDSVEQPRPRHGAAGRRSWWGRWGRHQDRSLARGNGRRRDQDHGHHL